MAVLSLPPTIPFSHDSDFSEDTRLLGVCVVTQIWQFSLDNLSQVSNYLAMYGIKFQTFRHA